MYSTLWGAIDSANAKNRLHGRLDIRTPEDLFATDDQVRERYRKPVESPRIEDSTAALLQAWQERDRSRGVTTAAAMSPKPSTTRLPPRTGGRMIRC